MTLVKLAKAQVFQSALPQAMQGGSELRPDVALCQLPEESIGWLNPLNACLDYFGL